MAFNLFQRVSQAPTNPKTTSKPRQFDVAELYQGPVSTGAEARQGEQPLDESMRSTNPVLPKAE